MSFKCGIVGLPNVGKSTLFNVLTQTIAAAAANYPFCTIEPNVGRAPVPDKRLGVLAKIGNSINVLPVVIDIVDIAGLVKGASKGEGLGNQFLANIREVDAILHVVRCFDDENVTHVHNKIDPLADIEIIETELILADYDSLQKRTESFQSKNKFNKEKGIQEQIDLMTKCLEILSQGKLAREILKNGYTYEQIKGLQLITTKPYLFICNIPEDAIHTGNAYLESVKNLAKQRGVRAIALSAKIESEIANLPTEEEKEFFLQEMNLKESGLSQVIQYGYEILNLETYFTVGPKETRAWTIPKGALAPQAAGVIHTDFEKGFIKAEVIGYDDYVKYNGEQGAKEHGKLHIEGKEYVVKDGDVIHFRFNV